MSRLRFAAVVLGAALAAPQAAFAQPETRDIAIENASALEPFFEAVAGGGPIRILHVGDSHIARGAFAGDLRAMLGEAFGASGRGLLPPGPIYLFHLARGLELDMSPGWELSAAIRDEDEGPFGLASGRIEAAAGSDPWVALSGIAGPADRLLIGYRRQPEGGALQINIDGNVQAVPTDGEAGPAFAALALPEGAQLVRVSAAGNGPVALTSLAIEADTGRVTYSSLGWPGATAEIMARWDDATLRAELARLDPDLIVIGYGTNEGFDDDLDVDAYAKTLGEQIARLKLMAPGAAVLLTGGPDGTRLPYYADTDSREPDEWRCTPLSPDERDNYAALVEAESPTLLRWHDAPNLVPVLAAQRAVALGAGAAHWDWRAAMGGPCSVHDWRLAEPPLAKPDHIHLTNDGALLTAAALHNALRGAFVAWAADREGVSVPQWDKAAPELSKE